MAALLVELYEDFTLSLQEKTILMYALLLFFLFTGISLIIRIFRMSKIEKEIEEERKRQEEYFNEKISKFFR